MVFHTSHAAIAFITAQIALIARKGSLRVVVFDVPQRASLRMLLSSLGRSQRGNGIGDEIGIPLAIPRWLALAVSAAAGGKSE